MQHVACDKKKKKKTLFALKKGRTEFNVSAYFLPLICLRWWKTLMTSRIRRGASSILEAKLIQAMATIWREGG